MRRLGLMPWLLGALLLTGLQTAAIGLALPGMAGPQGVISPLMALLAVILLQGLKWPITVGRLLDLGRPSEDAILLLAPILSTFLFVSLLSGTPREKVRKKRMRAWEGRTLALAAWLKGWRAMLGAPVITLFALLITGGFAGFVELVAMPGFRALAARPPVRPNQIVGPPSDSQVLVFQIVLGVLALSGLWLVLQIIKRKTAARASWLPTLLLPPGLLIAVALWPRFAEMFGPDAAPPGFFGAGLGLGWWIFGGGVVTTLFIALGQDLHEHGQVQMGRALGLWRERIFDALAIHGGTVTVVFIGLQVVAVPGIVYAIFMAFAVHFAMLQPQASPFRASQRLTRGWWRPVFVLLVLGVVPAIALQLASLMAVDFVQAQLGFESPFIDEQGFYSPARFLAAWITVQAMPSTITFPPLGVAIGAALSALCMGATNAGLVWTFHERIAMKDTKTRKAAPAAEPEEAATEASSEEA